MCLHHHTHAFRAAGTSCSTSALTHLPLSVHFSFNLLSPPSSLIHPSIAVHIFSSPNLLFCTSSQPSFFHPPSILLTCIFSTFLLKHSFKFLYLIDPFLLVNTVLFFCGWSRGGGRKTSWTREPMVTSCGRRRIQIFTQVKVAILQCKNTCYK